MDDEERLRVCLFVVAGEEFAIDIMRIQEIVRPLAVTPVPKAPSGMEGLVDLRGSVMPLFDLRVRLDKAPRGSTEIATGRFLVTRVGTRTIALAVDEVLDVVEYRRAELRVGEQMLSGPAGALFVGVCPANNGGLAMLLNLHELLTEEDRVAIDAAALRAEVKRRAEGSA